tara:strand:+ start:2006 stop:2278 length:273 start_codon:yes stop_codon:yes gene_type:complete
MIKIYTITTDGLSNGNVIEAPFEIQVDTMQYSTDLKICACTKNAAGVMCDNDDVSGVLTFELPSMTTGKVTDLAATIEVLLEEVYPGSWA